MNSSHRHSPLYLTIGEIAALWAAADVGYRAILPVFGFSISYNEDPVAIALYYSFWLAICILTFRSIILEKIRKESRFLLYGALSLSLGTAMLILLYWFAQFPSLTGKLLVPYTDILLASPWYFLPKSVEVLVQQTLISVFIFRLANYYKDLRKISAAFALLFGGSHIFLFALGGAPTPYAFIMTVGAILSALIFPFLLLRVPGGFIWSYAIHWAFYLALALTLHTWPPPEYSPISTS